MSGGEDRSRPREDRGAATIFVLVLVAVLGVVAVGGAVAGGALVGQRRAAAAADLAALAGAEALQVGGGSASSGVGACEAAGRVSERNEARLTGCSVEGLEVVVEVAVDVPAVFGGEWSIPGGARAGPGSPGSPRGPGGPGLQTPPKGTAPATGSAGPSTMAPGVAGR